MAEGKATSASPYLRSCKEECHKPLEGETRGQIPNWLKGCLIRNGPGLMEIGDDKFKHVFDGMALVHRFGFQDGRVTYQNRFVRSDTYRRNTEANKIVVSEFGTKGAPDPCKTIFQKFASFFVADDFTDNDLVNIIVYGDKVYACTEATGIWQIDTTNLESLKKVDLKEYFPVDLALAHAHEDNDGTVYNLGTQMKLHPEYKILKFPAKDPFERGSVVASIPASRFMNISYFHSFGMTENYFVLVEQPLFLNQTKMAVPGFASTFAEALKWDAKAHCRFHVVHRSDGRLVDHTYESAAFFVFHHINAYEEKGYLVVDLCGYGSGEVINTLYVHALEEEFRTPKKIQEPFLSKARRYVIPLSPDKSSKDKNLVSLPQTEATAHLQANGRILLNFEVLTGAEMWAAELPRINYEKYNGKKYRYFYSMAKNDSLERTHLIKVDVENKVTLSWNEADAIPSEPVFLPKPGSEAEDEDSGIVLASLLYKSDETRVSMLVLDAKTWKELGRVDFKTNASVPADFHGTFIQRD